MAEEEPASPTNESGTSARDAVSLSPTRKRTEGNTWATHEVDPSKFTSADLLKVMTQLSRVDSISYFSLCRDIGVSAVNALVRAQILGLRWTKPITNEDSDDGPEAAMLRTASIHDNEQSQEGNMLPVGDADLVYMERAPRLPQTRQGYSPTIVCASPVMLAAMRDVLKDYESSDQSSEYASLTDVDEY